MRKKQANKYPLCAKLGVLRNNANGCVVVSTSALIHEIGWRRYRKYLPEMKHAHCSGPTPESCEKFLQSVL